MRSTRQRRTRRLRPPLPQTQTPPLAAGTRPPAAAAGSAGAATGRDQQQQQQQQQQFGGGAGFTDELQLDDVFQLDWGSAGETSKTRAQAAADGSFQKPQSRSQQRDELASARDSGFGARPLLFADELGLGAPPSPPAQLEQQQQQQQQQQQLPASGRGQHRRGGSRSGVSGAASAGAFLRGLAAPLPGIAQGGSMLGAQQRAPEPQRVGRMDMLQQEAAGADDAIEQERQHQQQEEEGVMEVDAAAEPLPQITSQTWAAAADELLPSLYDPSWHTSLAAFAVDLWDRAAAAHDKRDDRMLRACYRFARACVAHAVDGSSGSSSAYAQGCCLLPLAEALAQPEGDGALLAGCVDGLGADAVRSLLLPMLERTSASPEAQQRMAEALMRSASRRQGGGGGSSGVEAQPAPGLWEGLERVAELTGVYPGTELSTVAHLAQQHGAWLD